MDVLGPPPAEEVVGKANVVAGITAVAALVLALRPWRWGRRPALTVVTAEQVHAAKEYLADETLRYWREQAKLQRINTPSPVPVRWQWAADDVAVPAPLASNAVVLTVGVVTQLRKQLYARLGERGRIVLLGEAGAGKTAAMLLLLIDVVEHRQPGDPVPVWLTLGSWEPDTTSLREWAAATMTRDYPGLAATEHGGRGAATRLLDTGAVALFLDGLDEMPPAVQGAALEAIDRHGGAPIVLTSRPTQYRDALTHGRLHEAAVVELLDVEIDQAEAFLLAEQLDQRRAAWQHVADHLRAHPDSVAARTLTTPLTLSLARDTYPGNLGTDPAALLDVDAHPTPDALRRHLLMRFLHRAYPEQDEREHAIRWLTWIAHRLGTTRDLRWWDIPTWTRNWRFSRAVLTGLVIGGLVGGLLAELVAGLVFGLIVGIAAGLTLGLGGSDMRSGPHTLNLRWPDGREWRQLLNNTSPVLGGMLVVALTFGHVDILASVLTGMVMVGGVVSGLISWLRELWRTPIAISHAMSPLKVFRKDRQSTVVIGLALGLGLGPLPGLALEPALGGLVGLLAGVLLFGLFGGLAIGAGPAIGLGIAQIGWTMRGRPVRFMALLEAALERQVLRQAGAVYQFRHAALQDYLADLARTQDKRPP